VTVAIDVRERRERPWLAAAAVAGAVRVGSGEVVRVERQHTSVAQAPCAGSR
jgi:hypothetical protein